MSGEDVLGAMYDPYHSAELIRRRMECYKYLIIGMVLILLSLIF